MHSTAPRAPGLAPDVSSTVVGCQGQIAVSGSLYTGPGYFKFAILDGTSNTVWSNDGTSVGQPTASVALSVSNGLFNVLLGDTTLGGTTQSLGATVFSGANRYLRVWFSSDNVTFAQLAPDRRVAAVPYALQALQATDADTLDSQHGAYYQNASNLDAGTLGNGYYSAISDLGAEGYLGNAGGDLAQNNGTLQTTLNADQLDGRDAGNAAGNIPTNNNTLNTNLNADRLDGLHAAAFQQHWAGVVVVAKNNGDYGTVQSAIDSIVGASAGAPYLVWVAPGVYSETVQMKPYVHVQGAGQDATVISSTVGGASWPSSQVTLRLASHSSLRDLTVANTGITGAYRVAIMSTGTMTDCLVADVAARSIGVADGYNRAIGLPASNNRYVTLQHVTAFAADVYDANHGLYADAGTAVLIAGNHTGSGGTTAGGILLSGDAIVAENFTALGIAGGTASYGLRAGTGTATLRGGSYTGSEGTIAYGVYNQATLDAHHVTALGEDGATSYGLYNDSANTNLVGGSYTGSAGDNGYGIHNEATLNASQVTAAGDGA